MSGTEGKPARRKAKDKAKVEVEGKGSGMWAAGEEKGEGGENKWIMNQSLLRKKRKWPP
jgi:hypothetical protein